ncbi:hypothetical protein [Streptomyces erythrochromogenes]|uniref:hypothetical protein n=1 Tax=Streptomyces erythrochromogenes TaxID=285574 RepID=UPI0036942E66
MSTSQRFGPDGVEHAEAVLVEQYPRLVRLAYLTLPDSLGRHTRVLLAHKAVQRALPRSGTPAGPAPAQGATDGSDRHLALVRSRVLRAALAPAGPAGTTWARIGRPPVPPFVWGLRLWPPAGGIDEAAQTLSGAPAPVRAAFVLLRLDDLAEDGAVRLLGGAGATDPAGAVRDALALPVGEDLLRALRRPEFDASVVSARPTDLLRRRRRARACWAGLATLALALSVLSVHGSDPGGPDVRPTAGSAAASRALDPARLQRVSAEAWSDTARVDFTAWPARGGRAGDRDLLARALGTWAAPGTIPVATTPGTTAEPPAQPPQLLYAGELDGRAVVLLRDGDRVVRYGETTNGSGAGRTLDVTRTDDAGVTTAAALTLWRAPDGASARYLLAPWIATAAARDLLRAGDTGRALAVAADGVTAPAAVPPAGGSCASWPVLELTSSTRIVEKHSFVLTDLGALSPVHLTYTPLPDGTAAPARQPREATGPEARAAWARQACRLGELRGGAYRAVNVWDFAAAQLPDGAGRAVWSCTRASGWAGPGDVTVRLRLEAGTPQDVARARSTAACGRFGQHLLAGFRWRSPAGRWYLLAAGSRQVSAIAATGAVAAGAAERTLVAPWSGPDGPVSLTGTLVGGGAVTGLDGAGGGRD